VRIAGPLTSPRSIRWRSATVLNTTEPVSTTVVKPNRVSIAVSARSSSSRGRVAASVNAASVRWMWLF